jgi:hypothetical protein
VPPPSRPAIRRRRTGAALALAIVVVFGSLLAAAVFHGFLVSGQSHLDQLDRDLVAAESELAREQLELADLQSPARIAAEAEAMGMVRSDQQTWLSPGTGADPVVTGDPAQPATDDASTDPTGATDPIDPPAATEQPAQATELADAPADEGSDVQ